MIKDMAIAAASSSVTGSARNPMPLSVVIVDDEQLARDELAYLLKNLGDVNVVAQGKNGLEAISLIREHNPDLVFLDQETARPESSAAKNRLRDCLRSIRGEGVRSERGGLHPEAVR
jgi:DNA-binding NarL/FixJ family response regulator